MKMAAENRSATARRRQRLANALGNRRALLPAGRAPSRNYPDATYPFRATSHFLYFVGVAVEGAWLMWDGFQFVLYAEEHGRDHALWHGPTPSLAELGELLGVATAPLSELDQLADPETVATIAAIDEATVAWQEKLLGRQVACGAFTDVDEPLVDAVIALRSIHDEAAIAGIRSAAAATAAAFSAGREAAVPGAVAFEVRAAMEGELLRRNMTTSFTPIVTTRGEVLHTHNHDTRLSDGDLLLVDFGAEEPGGFAADVTRTWPVGESYSTTQQAMIDVVLAAQKTAIDRCRPGTRYRDVHQTACETLAGGLVELGVLEGDPAELVADGVHALLFPHGVGHLLGLDVHDMEDLGDRASYAPGRERSSQFGTGFLRLDRDLEPGMAVTIEPGLYVVPAILDDPELAELAGDRLNRDELAKFADVRGIRIEDDILVTNGDPEVLTTAIAKPL